MIHVVESFEMVQADQYVLRVVFNSVLSQPKYVGYLPTRFGSRFLKIFLDAF